MCVCVLSLKTAIAVYFECTEEKKVGFMLINIRIMIASMKEAIWPRLNMYGYTSSIGDASPY